MSEPEGPKLDLDALARRAQNDIQVRVQAESRERIRNKGAVRLIDLPTGGLVGWPAKRFIGQNGVQLPPFPTTDNEAAETFIIQYSAPPRPPNDRWEPSGNPWMGVAFAAMIIGFPAIIVLVLNWIGVR